ncbi:MFS general substrate transporter [Hypomontagnella monticulosa]|nr:MFS general substrate transporter [Hypomontagnella monticulosa]
MFFCHGLQAVDKGCVGTQATFGLREDTGLIGQQYSWLTTIFYVTYLCFEVPSIVLLQRYSMGKLMSLYIVCWGLVVLCVGFAQNFTHLITLRALQGLFECTISPGLLLIVGSWYTTREHPSRSLVFQSGYAGVGLLTDGIVYSIGTVSYKIPGFQAWRYMSFFLGGLTILAGVISFFILGTPSEVRWLSADEKKIANARILTNNTGHDRTAVKDWKWEQVRECFQDPTVWIAGANAFLGSVPNGGLTAFSGILVTSFGFTNLQMLVLNIPKYIFTLIYFIIVGVVVTKKKDIRMWVMILSNILPMAGFLVLVILPNEPQHKWVKWTGHFIIAPFITATFLAWSLVPSNVAGRTKRTVVSSVTFVMYCVGNMAGSQIFQAKDAPRYISGTTGCAVCLGIQMLFICLWRIILVRRNQRRDKLMRDLGLSEEDVAKTALEMGEQDRTDRQNPYVSPEFTMRPNFN